MSTLPSPRPAPGPVERFDINVDDATFEQLTRWTARYGDLFRVLPQDRPDLAFVLNHPAHIRHVLIANHRNYIKGVGFERVKMLLGNGIIVSDGAFWRSQRRMIQPAFHRKVIESLSHMMRACNRRKLVEWQQKAALGEVIDVTTEMSELALEVILRALFGDDLDRLVESQGENPFAILTDDVTRDLKLAMRFRALTRHVQALMDQRRSEARIETDFLSLLMETRDKDTGAAMSDKALIDEVMTIIVAGHETTAGTLNWAWYLLSQHPEVRTRLQQEVDALAGDPDFEQLEQLRYTRQVVDETLRLYPPVWLFSRKAKADDRIDGVTIPAGADIFLCPWLMHRDARFWDSPDAFDPERFSDDAIRERNRDVYYPFSLGSRRCIGEFFSMVDMQLHLAQLSQHLTLQLQTGEPVAIEPHINLRSRHSILMRPVAR